MKTLTRYIPHGYTQYTPEIGDYPKDLFAVYVDLAKLSAIFYAKKQSTHTFFNRFRTLDDMKKKINTTISSLMSHEDRIIKRAVERKAPTTLKVGDILQASWGYDQTNVDFYLVTKVVGTRTVELREIGSKVVSGAGSPCENVVPNPDVFIKDTIYTKRVSNGYVNFSSYKTARKWDGQPCYQTGGGFGH